MPDEIKVQITNDVAFGNPVYQTATPWLVDQAKADSTNTMPAIGLFVGDQIVKTNGIVQNGKWNWTPGNEVYVSAATAGVLTQTAPSAGGTFAQVIGIALDPISILLNVGQYMKAN